MSEKTKILGFIIFGAGCKFSFWMVSLLIAFWHSWGAFGVLLGIFVVHNMVTWFCWGLLKKPLDERWNEAIEEAIALCQWMIKDAREDKDPNLEHIDKVCCSLIRQMARMIKR